MWWNRCNKNDTVVTIFMMFRGKRTKITDSSVTLLVDRLNKLERLGKVCFKGVYLFWKSTGSKNAHSWRNSQISSISCLYNKTLVSRSVLLCRWRTLSVYSLLTQSHPIRVLRKVGERKTKWEPHLLH